MRYRLAYFCLCLVASVAWQAPASLADSILKSISKNTVALLGTEGSLWSGNAMLAIPDPSSGRFVPFMPIRWHWQPSFMLRGQLRWQFSAGGSEPGNIAFTFTGPSVEMLRISMPARYALERIPHAIGRAGWRGDMLLAVQRWHCNWGIKCAGDANLQWFGAGSDLFPLRKFGDYQLNIHAQNGVMDLLITTMRGDINIQAAGKLEPPAHFQLTGTITGDPAFVDRLPNIGGNVVTPDGAPGRMKFSIRQ